jgi:hypothetical protein
VQVRLGVKAALVDDELVVGDVAITDGFVGSVGLSPAGKAGLAVPGFIDVQINGFDGVDFTTADPDDFEVVGKRLASSGVTAFQPTLITLPPQNYLTAIERLAATSIRSGRILGMHLEGPFLSPTRCGAHDPANMLDPDLALSVRETTNTDAPSSAKSLAPAAAIPEAPVTSTTRLERSLAIVQCSSRLGSGRPPRPRWVSGLIGLFVDRYGLASVPAVLFVAALLVWAAIESLPLHLCS